MKNTEEDDDILFRKASELRERGDNKTAFSLFMKGAKGGYGVCQFMLGYMYDIGEGVKRDPLKALYWYKKAKKEWLQDGALSNNIAIVYEEMGNFVKANYYWKKAIQLGDVEALFTNAQYLLRRRRVYVTKVIALLEKYIQSDKAFPDIVEEAKQFLRKFRRITKNKTIITHIPGTDELFLDN
jgi:TPR repeat protein